MKIGENEKSLIENLINPCSIDLRIADFGYLKTRRKTVDPQSIENVSGADELWTKVKVYNSKNQNHMFFKIHPGETILTHTKERLKIPNDCAGKIEIKSTYARLSLSISFGDFCNPGYDGYFPLEITNHGKHTILLHQGETMAQLMLVPLNGPILVNYTDKATYKNNEGYDDGTPYTFWRERSIKLLRKQKGTDKIINAYHTIVEKKTKNERTDINAFKERFNNTFLAYCQKKLHSPKYLNQDGESPNTKKIINEYAKREDLLSKLSPLKWISFLVDVLLVILPFILEILKVIEVSITKLLACLIPSGVILLAISIVIYLKWPKHFCTLEDIDIDKLV